MIKRLRLALKLCVRHLRAARNLCVQEGGQQEARQNAIADRRALLMAFFLSRGLDISSTGRRAQTRSQSSAGACPMEVDPLHPRRRSRRHPSATFFSERRAWPPSCELHQGRCGKPPRAPAASAAAAQPSRAARSSRAPGPGRCTGPGPRCARWPRWCCAAAAGQTLAAGAAAARNGYAPRAAPEGQARSAVSPRAPWPPRPPPATAPRPRGSAPARGAALGEPGWEGRCSGCWP
mmetsp:Transcript_103538/g.281256  ORF Transcript_103538/g.281256 Transcript_103538/m.281256 type:complete len:235 (-) Transcript_103538:691-1395(-)